MNEPTTYTCPICGASVKLWVTPTTPPVCSGKRKHRARNMEASK